MIELSATTAIMLYLCLTLATLLAIWGMHHYSTRKQKIDLIEEKLYVCEYCFFAFLDKTGKQVTRCPQCNSYNKGKKTKNLR